MIFISIALDCSSVIPNRARSAESTDLSEGIIDRRSLHALRMVELTESNIGKH